MNRTRSFFGLLLALATLAVIRERPDLVVAFADGAGHLVGSWLVDTIRSSTK